MGIFEPHSLWYACSSIQITNQNALPDVVPGGTSELNDRDFIIRNIYKDLHWYS